MTHPPRDILVVAPFMHRLGHYTTYPVDLAHGFLACGARVTLVYPIPAAAEPVLAPELQTLCLQENQAEFGRIMAFLWPRLNQYPTPLPRL